MATTVDHVKDFFPQRVLVSTLVLAGEDKLLLSVFPQLAKQFVTLVLFFSSLQLISLAFNGGTISGFMGCFTLAFIALVVTAAPSAGADLDYDSGSGTGFTSEIGIGLAYTLLLPRLCNNECLPRLLP